MKLNISLHYTNQKTICLEFRHQRPMKFYTLVFIFLSVILKSQTYEKDWAALNAKLEAGQSPSIQEGETFLSKYKTRLANYPDNTTQLYSVLGNAYYNQSNYGKAEEDYLQSYRYARLSNDTSLKHIVELSLAILYYNTNNLLEAEKYYLACMSGMAAVYGQSSREYTQIFYDYTRLLIDIGRYETARPYVEALLYYYKTLDGEKNSKYLGLLNCKAIIFQNTGSYNEAIGIYSDIINAGNLLPLGDTLGHVITISNLGDIYRETGQYTEGILELKKAKTLYYKYHLKNEETLATIENNIALCYKSTGEMKMAEEAYNSSLEIYRRSGQTETEPYCSVLSNKADLLRMLGRFGEASELLLNALDIRKKRFGDKTENYANALSNLANVYFDAAGSGEEHFYKEALERNLQAEAIYKEVVGEEHQSYANCMNSLSLCYLQFKDYSKAEACKRKALEVIEKTVGKDHYRYSAYLISTYGLYRQTNQLDKAERTIKEALQLVEKNFGKKHELYANAELILAEICSLRQKYEEAGPFYRAALDFYSGQINDYFDAMSEENQGHYLSMINMAFESYNSYLINYRLNFQNKDLSQELKLCLKYQLLLKSLLANKSARVRREVMASNDNNLKHAYDEWLNLKNQLINNFKATETAEDNNELIKRISELESYLKQHLGGFSENKELGFEQLQQKLNGNEAAIEIFKVRETLNDTTVVVKYGALVIRKDKQAPLFVVFKEGARMEAQGFESYFTCIDEQKKDSTSYDLYFKKFEPALPGITKLYVSSDGVFHKLSWQSLYNPLSKKYLGEEYEIYQTSNLGSIVRKQGQTPNADQTASLFGYPDYDYDFKLKKDKENLKAHELVAKRFGLVNLAKLPGTKTEVEEIAKELTARKWKSTVFTGEFASEENLRKVNSPKVLHIATHGYYLKDIESDDKLFLGFDKNTIKNNSLLRSGIILAGAGPATQDSTNRNSENDGVLTAGEAGLLNLSNTDLVVLSACQTGLGDEMGTEGVAGLQRSFTIAGAKNILMSLWPVDDFATQYLMTEFYKNYALSGDVESSFKLAQTQVRKKYPQPVYWAAFVLLRTFN